MTNTKNSGIFEGIIQAHTILLQKKGDLLRQKESSVTTNLVNEAQNLIDEICSSSINISDPNWRKSLESYIDYWSPLIYEATGNYPIASLQSFRGEDQKNEKAQKVLNYLGAEEGSYNQELILSKFGEILDPSFKFSEKVKYVIEETLIYIGNTTSDCWDGVEESERSQGDSDTVSDFLDESEELEQVIDEETNELSYLVKSIACICQMAYLSSLHDILTCWLDGLERDEKNTLLSSFSNRYIYELIYEQIDFIQAWISDLGQNEYSKELETILFSFKVDSESSKLARSFETGLNKFITNSRNSSDSDTLSLDLAPRVTRNTHRFLIAILKSMGDITSYLVEDWLSKYSDNRLDTIRQKYGVKQEDYQGLSNQEKIDLLLDTIRQKYDVKQEDWQDLSSQEKIDLLKFRRDIASHLEEEELSKLSKCVDNGRDSIRQKYDIKQGDWQGLSNQEKIDLYLDRENKKYETIDKYLEQRIKGKFDNTNVFHEEFTFKDIYTDIYARFNESKDDAKKILNARRLATEIKDEKKRPKNKDRVLFIEGEPGSGKTTLCRMFSDWILHHWYPLWTPIWIKLRDIKELGKDFKETLEKALKDNEKGLGSEFFDERKNPNWLNDCNTCFVFLLDGLDELLFEQYTGNGWEAFLKQAIEFQKGSGTNLAQPKHHVLITSYPKLFRTPDLVPEQLMRIEIQSIDKDFREKWLEKLANFYKSEKWLTDEKWKKDKRTYFKNLGFEKNEDVARKIDEIAQKLTSENKRFTEKLGELTSFLEKELQKINWIKDPLLLYLLTAMWRDGKLYENKFNKYLNPGEAKLIIYQEILDWLIDKRGLKDWITTWIPAEQLGAEEKEKENIEVFKSIIKEMGLCAVQSGGIRTSTILLENRMADRDRRLLEPTRELIKKKSEEDISALISIEEEKGDCDKKSLNLIRFNHKSFSEFLYARRLVESLENWTRSWKDCDRSDRTKYLEFLIPTDRLDWEIYDLLGFGGLTREIIEEYLRGLIKQSPILKENNLIKLSCRLRSFFDRWFEEQFVDGRSRPNLPHQKMMQLLEPLKVQGLSISWRQVDIYTGLNVLILLLELHRQIQDPFYPCGVPQNPRKITDQQPDKLADSITERFDPTHLLRLIGYSNWIGTDVFVKIVGPFLEGINLRGVDLHGAELPGVNLKDAYLSGSHLDGINLSGANLAGAFLGNAQLPRADISNADLTGAFLGNVNLSNAYLEKTKLHRAVLIGANLRTANLVHANLEEAELGDADLSDANLRGANLKNANLSCTNLGEANLQGVYLAGANLTATIITEGTNLEPRQWDKDNPLIVDEETKDYLLKKGYKFEKTDR